MLAPKQVHDVKSSVTLFIDENLIRQHRCAMYVIVGYLENQVGVVGPRGCVNFAEDTQQIVHCFREAPYVKTDETKSS